MSGEERKLARTHAHDLRNKHSVQSEMKRGVKTGPALSFASEGGVWEGD